MKYLKLYEAFDSLKLSKMFGYLNKDSKSDFMIELKKICDYLDYPLSKLKDDDFQYLTYKEAYNINRPYAKDLEIVKFWFNSKGDYIDKTGIKGNFRYFGINSKLPSDDINSYNSVGSELSMSGVKELKEGDLVYLRTSSGQGPGFFHKFNDRMFILQNHSSGTSPNEYGDKFDWKKIAIRSWIIINESDYRELYKIELKKELQTDKPEYKFNTTLYKYEDITHSYDPEIFKKANFALILDLKKLDNLSLKDKKTEREIRKKGAFRTDAEIKSENIKRYFNEILKTEKIISDPKRVLNMIIKKENFLSFIYQYLGKIEYLNSAYFDIISDVEKDSIDRLSSNIREIFMDFRKEYIDKNSKVNKNISKIKDKLPDDENVFFDNLEELNGLIYDKIKSIEVKDILDLEILYNKLKNIDYFLGNNRNNFGVLYDVVKNLKDEWRVSDFIYVRENIKEFNEKGFDRIKELINRL